MAEILSSAECLNLASVMDRKLASGRGDRRFSIKCESISDGLHVTVLLSSPSGSFYYPVEARMKAGEDQRLDRAAALFLVEFIDQYFDTYLNYDKDTYLPIDWTDFESDGRTFQVKGQVLNMELEKLADAILERGETLLI